MLAYNEYIENCGIFINYSIIVSVDYAMHVCQHCSIQLHCKTQPKESNITAYPMLHYHYESVSVNVIISDVCEA